MRPIGVVRAAHGEGPGYFASTLEARSIEWQLIALDAGAPVPKDARRFSGLVFMGGPMSVNDDLPWIPRALELIRDAVRKDVPLLGHCLGGQLMAKALGGSVRPNGVKEIGWGEVRVADNALAREWLGEHSAFESFHWHGETFSIPPGGTRLLEGRYCPNQAFSIGKHFGMQCHVEMTEALVRDWVAHGRDEIEASGDSPAVQTPEEILARLPQRLERLHQVAGGIYERWLEGLSRGS